MFYFLILSFSPLTDVLVWTLSTLHLAFGAPITDHWTVQWSTTIQTKLIRACSARSVYLFLSCLNSSYDPCSERPLHNSLHQAPKQALSIGLFDFKLICQANNREAAPSTTHTPAGNKTQVLPGHPNVSALCSAHRGHNSKGMDRSWISQKTAAVQGLKHSIEEAVQELSVGT